MLRHDVKHFCDIHIVFLLLSGTMRFKLLDKLPLVVFIDVRDLLRRQLILILALNAPERNLIRIREPNRFVVIFQKFALHAKNFDFVQLRNIVRHLVAHFKAVLELISLD